MRRGGYVKYVLIRVEKSADQEAIGAVITSAFLEAEYSSGKEAAIVEILRKADVLTVSLVATDEAKIIGYVAFSPVNIDGLNDGWFGLGPVAVDPDCQREGIGSALIEAGLASLKEQGARGCVVLGEPGYYGRFGFAADANLILEGVPPEYFQRLSFDGSSPGGRVDYHPAFGVS